MFRTERLVNSRSVFVLLAVLAVTALAGTAVLGGLPGADAATTGPQKKTVKLGDNFFSPSKLTVNRDSTITWKWPNDVGDTHDVKLQRGPSGVKKFKSAPAAIAFSYKRKLTKPGKYYIICTFHEQEMTMNITVRK